jgi:hypothetical protein
MTMSNGMKILGPGFKLAPSPKATGDGRNPLRELKVRQEVERQRAAARLELHRKVTAASGKT